MCEDTKEGTLFVCSFVLSDGVDVVKTMESLRNGQTCLQFSTVSPRLALEWPRNQQLHPFVVNVLPFMNQWQGLCQARCCVANLQ